MTRTSELSRAEAELARAVAALARCPDWDLDRARALGQHYTHRSSGGESFPDRLSAISSAIPRMVKLVSRLQRPAGER